jgi:hypothetical protein
MIPIKAQQKPNFQNLKYSFFQEIVKLKNSDYVEYQVGPNRSGMLSFSYLALNGRKFMLFGTNRSTNELTRQTLY